MQFSFQGISKSYYLIFAQDVLQQEGEDYSHRSWVVQEDKEASAGAELVLKTLRDEAHSCGQGPAAASHAWEEVDSQAAIVGPSNDIGAASEILQEPGHLLALQVLILLEITNRSVKLAIACLAAQAICKGGFKTQFVQTSCIDPESVFNCSGKVTAAHQAAVFSFPGRWHAAHNGRRML